MDRVYPMDRVIMMICDMQYVMGHANAVRDANTFGTHECEYAIGRTNAIRNTRIRYGRANAILLYAISEYTLWAARMRYAIRE